MGLDMFAYAVDKDEVDGVVDVRADCESDREELGYWRKENALHAWMQDLYYDKGGEKEFNCTGVLLTEEDLDKLLQDSENRRLTPRGGFFFGGTEYTEENWQWLHKSIEEFVRKAKENIKEGKVVYYTSWW